MQQIQDKVWAMGNRCCSHISNDRSSSLATWISSSLHAVRSCVKELCLGPTNFTFNQLCLGISSCVRIEKRQTKTQTLKEITLPYLPVNPCIGLLCVFFLLRHVLFSPRFGGIEMLLFLLAWTRLWTVKLNFRLVGHSALWI